MTGGGDSQHFHEIDRHFVSRLSESPSLLLIPLANKECDYEDCLGRIVDTFSSIHFDNIQMCNELSQLDWSLLKDFDAIYIDGGNTFRLMEKIRQSHFYELLRKFVHRGGVINGDSAGAIILGSHLQTAHFGEFGDVNQSSLISYQGLNLLGEWAIHCHYHFNENDEIITFVNEYGLPVLALPEDAAISIENRVLTVFGNSEVTLFKCDNIKKVKPGFKSLLD